MNFVNKLVHIIFDCNFVEEKALFFDDGAFWRETKHVCKTCGKIDFISHFLLDDEEFWEQESSDLYCFGLENY